MWRYFVGVAAGVLLVLGGVLVWRNSAAARHATPLLPDRLTASTTADDGNDTVPEPPAASEKTREEKRFSRYDHDKDGKVSRDEFLAARRKAFAKLDANGDGQLSFDEYAVKTETRFAGADGDRSGALTPVEFASTKVQRTSKPRCAPAGAAKADDDG